MNADDRWMAEAIAEARSVIGRTAPRPSVGAVLVREGQVIARGSTRPFPGAHAEPTAIALARQSGVDPRGSTMYVTLEPCCHHGRTPPCTDAILDAGITRVVAGMIDPYPPMRGRGLEVLRQAGVDVVVGVGEAECRAIVRGFSRAIERGLPEVTAKVATSLDGALATGDGESKWITGEAARAHGQRLRVEHDAILVGIGTILADDPRLTSRLEAGTDPVPVVLDTSLRIPDRAAIFGHPRRPLLICATDAPDRAVPADICRVPRAADGRLDVEAALRAVAKAGLHRVLVEGGAAIHRTLLDAHLVDTLCVYVAGMVIPGGRPWLGGPPVHGLAAAPRFGAPEVEILGDDVLLRYSLPYREA